MSFNPTVSITIITYNHENYIADAINGILNQVIEFPIEIIIGEDCSKDNTKKIIEEYTEKYPDLIYLLASETNLGPIENAFRVVNHSKGKYIAFCEGDDFWNDPYKLKKQVDFLENNPEYGLVHTDCDMLNQNSGKIESRINHKSGKNIFDPGSRQELSEAILVGKYVLRTATVMLRSELLGRVETSDVYKNALANYGRGDIPLWLELSRITKFKYFNETTAVYRKSPNSATLNSNLCKRLNFEIRGIELRKLYAKSITASKKTMRTLNIRYEEKLLKSVLSNCRYIPEFKTSEFYLYFLRLLIIADKCKSMRILLVGFLRLRSYILRKVFINILPKGF